MRTIAFLIPVVLVAVSACNDSEAAHEPVFGGELPATNFVVDPAKDTVLKTPGGALITIPAGALQAGDATTVSLEVKEAYTADDISRGGLRGNGDTLTSSGIIYVNVTGGQSVSINKPLNISIPAKEAGDMSVYKGEAGENALLRWADPRPLGSKPGSTSTDAGKELFQSNCASCHGGKSEAAGPPLAWIGSRRDKQWLYAFTRNNATLLWRGDAYTCYLFNRYKTPMPLFKNLSDADLSNLYRYIDNASRGIDSNSVPDHKRSFDSCVVNDPNCGKVAQRRRAVPAQEPAADTTATEAAVMDYYTFTIDKHGWYNVAHKGSGASGAGSGPGSSEMASATSFPEPTNSVQPGEPLKACPCWCDESAYRRADSLGRAKPH